MQSISAMTRTLNLIFYSLIKCATNCIYIYFISRNTSAATHCNCAANAAADIRAALQLIRDETTIVSDTLEKYFIRAH